eukprot:7731603-Pyramimonas_sp.AAC.1
MSRQCDEALGLDVPSPCTAPSFRLPSDGHFKARTGRATQCGWVRSPFHLPPCSVYVREDMLSGMRCSGSGHHKSHVSWCNSADQQRG